MAKNDSQEPWTAPSLAAMSDLARELAGKIDRQEARVGIIGLGYVGLPLALAFVESGFAVTGFDVDEEKVNSLAAGRTYIQHLGQERVAAALATGRLAATGDYERIAEVDALLITVPTPLTRQREPDMRYIVGTSEQILPRLRRGLLVVLESTTYPGTTDTLVREILERNGLRAGADFFLAYSPEREDPGNRRFDTRTIPKVVGGYDAASTELAVALYRRAVAEVVPVSSARAAEAAKLTENVFRAVNIALVNELKVVYDRMGIDVWEVLDAAATKPFGFMRFNPGPGLGGHCIPLDPFYLTWKAREYGVATRFIELAGEVNVGMPEYVVGKLQNALNDRGKPLKGSRVLLLGLAYKKDIDDPRESPSFELWDRMAERGATVAYHDPHIPQMPTMRSWPHLPAAASIALDPATVASFDAVLLATDHTRVDYDMVVEHARLVIDTRGIYRTPRDNVVKA
jgi:UDP-N-acetyl-D-glucosamine dehydrogenase